MGAEEVMLNTEKKLRYNPVIHNEGVTVAERYLSKLCRKTFLSLWSYPGLYRDQGGHGKEISDLLVVCGDHIIIFSDKDCEFKPNADLERSWSRWFRRAIWKSAEQVWGARRWIIEQPGRIFLDRDCKQLLPIKLPDPKRAKIHLVVVAHGISKHIANYHGGTGSLMIDSAIKGFEQHTQPFYVGDLDALRPFVHVYDDYSLQALVSSRDTITDFVQYLEKRQSFLRRPERILCPGDEELLASYLKTTNAQGEHDFDAPAENEVQLIMVGEGHWEEFEKHPQRIAQLNQDEISYAWDRLIERFNHYALRAEQHYVTAGGITDCELILRFMAKEPRVKRRGLSTALHQLIQRTKRDQRGIRVIAGSVGEPYYLFVVFPAASSRFFESHEYDEYRAMRREFLYRCCAVVRLMYPDAQDIVGLCTESGMNLSDRSEDACYFDARQWNEELARDTRDFQNGTGVLTRGTYSWAQWKEYPDVPSRQDLKNPRNKKCLCGSGKKYKHCCLR